MYKMKKILFILMAAVLILSGALITGCNTDDGSGKMTIVCTNFASYDFARNIVGDSDSFEVIYLLNDGCDPHSFNPSVSDIAKVSGADLLFYLGGESDTWAESAFNNNKDGTGSKLSMLECVRDKWIYKNHDHAEEQAGEKHVDEHIWLSLELSVDICERLTEAVISKDGDNSELYLGNFVSYKNKLISLNEKYKAAVADSNNKTLIFADRFPFIYMSRDYGFGHYSAFEGCSADSEVGVSTIKELGERLSQLGLSHICVIETSDTRLAESIIADSGVSAEIVTFNSLQSVSQKMIDNGTTYLGVMENNLEALRAALS